MKPTRACPKCAAPLPADAPQGHCPQCLLSLALEDQPTLTSISNPPPPGPRSYAEPPETETKHPVLGTRLGYVGDYELLEEIARGGMGVVYRARQSSLKRIVAVKMIRSGEFAGEAEVKRFRAEAEAAANLKHPNIVAIHEIGEHEGRHYFSMDYIEGKNLAQVCGGQPVAARQAAEWLKAIAEAVQFAHQRGVLHRDLKPQNILVDAEGRPHVTDFGLAKDLHADSGVTQTGAVMGSPSYMAPEQARGRNDLVGPASDVYSLGAVLYELLTGRAPFRGGSAMETLQRVANDEPARPRSLNQDAPADLETICLKCLEKEPVRRYPTARALAEDVGRFLAGEPIQAQPASVARRVMSWARRHPAVLAGAAALVMFALAGFAFYLAEENAFLRAKAAMPDLVRKPGGPAGRSMGIWLLASVGVIVMTFGVMSAFIKQARRVSWQQMFDPAGMTPLQPVSAQWRAVTTAAGLVCVGCGLVTMVKVVRAQVWEGIYRGNISMLLVAFAIVFAGVFTLAMVWRVHRLSELGRAVRQLSAAQHEAIRAALLEMDVLGAIRLYRAAVPGAGLIEAQDHATRVLAQLREQEPEKFAEAARKLNPLNINVWAMMVCGMFEGAAFAPMVLRAEQPASFAYYFAAGFLLGVGATVAARVKGFWRRLPLIGMSLAMTVGGRLADLPVTRENIQIAPYLIGTGFGLALMFIAYKRRQPRKEL
jgi:tRNA A-37 threonylcarbamoyl transferase component Bud32